jgi:hypothetical protein
MNSISSDSVQYQAASLAFAMLRFEDRAAHPALGYTPHGAARIGVDS